MTPETLKSARQSLGLTQSQMAKAVGYGSGVRWSELENGVRSPSAAVKILVGLYLDGCRPDVWPPE